MNQPTLPVALMRDRRALLRWSPQAGLIVVATLVAMESVMHPHAPAARPFVPAQVASAISPLSAAPRLPFVSSLISSARTDTSSPAATPPPWELANLASPRVDGWVKRFTTTQRDEFGASLGRRPQFASMIAAKLAERRMPQELVYLAMIESEFKPRARSRVAAVGLWQFMSGTARMFGLRVGHGMDDRVDPAQETDAALAYLGELFTRFGSWYLAAAAYNAGEGAVSRALRRTTGGTTGTDADFYRIAPHLPAETRDYVPKIIAAARIGKNPASYGFAD